MNIPDFSYEKNAADHDLIVIGVDEAGRGPLAGPVVTAACALKTDHAEETEKLWDFVRDSKTVSTKKREEVYDFVRDNFYVCVSIVSPETIDRVNILAATLGGMKASVRALHKTLTAKDVHQKTQTLIDGNQLLPDFDTLQKCVTSGDATVKSIAAASIVAKVTRDRLMAEYDKQFPAYGFGTHKGYGTKAHMEALQKHGPCLIHRQSFAPVKRATRSVERGTRSGP